MKLVFLSPLYVQAFGIKYSSSELAGHSLRLLLAWALDYLSYTTSLQLRTTVIPDTVAIVAWTVDTNLKPRREETGHPKCHPRRAEDRGCWPRPGCTRRAGSA